MSNTTATATRIAKQLSHDPHTIALALLVPTVLMTVLRFVFQNQPGTFQMAASSLLGIFPFLVMFLIASISMLRERKAGTLERLMTLPIAKIELMSGYAITFGMLAAAQAALVGFVTLQFLGLKVIPGSEIKVVVIAMLAGILGMTLGLVTSSRATSEFQAVQFLPAFIFPQVLVCGLFAPTAEMAWPLQWLANVTPPFYLVEAMHTTTADAMWPTHDLAVITMFLVGSLALAAGSIRASK